MIYCTSIIITCNNGSVTCLRTYEHAKNITELDPVELVSQLRQSNAYLVKLDGNEFEINSDDVIITERQRLAHICLSNRIIDFNLG